MSRIRTSLYIFCRERASEALRNAEMSDRHRDYEYWSELETKWNDLADYYYRDERAPMAQPQGMARAR
jgi:hypothetical protein